MDEATRSMTGSIGKEWKKIGDDGKGICSQGTIRIHS